VKGTVAPGASYKFAFDLVAPNKPGTYDEFFGVVQEGVTWFSAPGQGGPADDVLEVKIVLVPSEAGPGLDAGHHADAAVVDTDAGAPESDAGETTLAPSDPNGGCSVGDSRSSKASWPLFGMALALCITATRRARRSS